MNEYLETIKKLKDNIFPTVMQEEKYKSDISIIGNPFLNKDKSKIVKFLAVENFPLKIFFECKSIIREVEPMMREYIVPVELTDDKINLIINFSNIIVNLSNKNITNIITSAYLNGCYITNYSKELEDLFIINKENELPNETHELIVYRNETELENILDYLLEFPDIKTSINNNIIKNIETNIKTLYEKLQND